MNIRITDYASIRDIEIDLSPGIQGFVGENAQGKTSVLNAVSDLVSGGNDADKIRDGAEKYVIQLQIYEDGKPITTVSRIQTKKGSRLEAKGIPDDMTPAKYLSTLFDSRLLNPIRLLRENPVDYLKKHLPVDLDLEKDIPEAVKPYIEGIPCGEGQAFDFCEKLCERIEAIRLETGQDKRQVESWINEMLEMVPKNPGIKAPHDIVIVNQAISERQKSLGAIEEQQKEIDEYEGRYKEKAKEIDIDADRLKEAERDFFESKDQLIIKENILIKIREGQKNSAGYLSEIRTILNKKQSELKSGESILEEIQGYRAKLRENDQWAKNFETHQKIQSKRSELEEISGRYQDLDEHYKYFAYIFPRDLILRADLPIKDLEFQGKELVVEGRRIDLHSEAEQALICVKIACAIAKRLNHVAISLDGMEIMDSIHFKKLVNIAHESGLKVFYTKRGPKEHDFEIKLENGEACGISSAIKAAAPVMKEMQKLKDPEPVKNENGLEPGEKVIPHSKSEYKRLSHMGVDVAEPGADKSVMHTGSGEVIEEYTLK